jgi:hypothetical protein
MVIKRKRKRAQTPSFHPNQVYACVSLNRFTITNKAQQDITESGLTRSDVRECLLSLLESRLYKTMASEKRQDSMMDVYHRRFKGKNWYIKLVINDDHPGGGIQVVVTSFKEK